MASTIKAGFGIDLDNLRLDLDSVEIGLGKLVAETATAQLNPILAEVRRHLPFDPTHRGWKGHNENWKAKKDPGHIRDSVVAGTDRNALIVRTTHPGGPVHWWGGTISPRGTPITIEHRPGAGEDFVSETADKVGEDVADALTRLCATHGL